MVSVSKKHVQGKLLEETSIQSGTQAHPDLEGLNPAQLKAVTHEKGPLMIVAGAGTGKTMAITRRIAWLINTEACRPEEILALTFTDKAAQEMIERVEERLPLGYPDLWVSTFHSFCQRLLQDHGLEIGLPDDFRLINETEAYLLVRKNFDRFDLDYYRPLGNPTKFIRALLKHFSRAKDEAVMPEEYLEYAQSAALDKDSSAVDDDDRSRLSELANAYHAYQQLLRDKDCLDLGDLILYAIQLLRKRPKILAKYRQQFRHIIVDEFQDTNWSQYELLKMLCGDKGNITVVGDDDQSIYKFRGASVSNILQFKSDFPACQEVVLSDNYRSLQEILDTAYGFIQLNNPNRLEAKLAVSKRLKAARGSGAEVSHLRFADMDMEAGGVVDKILELKQSEPTAAWSDFAVLVRSNASAEPFSLEFRRRGIPFQFLALKGLYNKPIIVDLMAYLKLLDDYHESPAMFRVLSSPGYRIDGNDLVKLVHVAKRKAISIYELATRHATLTDLQPETHQALDRLLSHMETHARMAKERSVSELFVTFLYESGIADSLRRADTLEARENASFINQFFGRLKRFEATNDDVSLPAFMEEYEMERDSGESGGLDFDPETGPDMVRVMTVHAAKGLEFSTVFIGQMTDKRFPSANRGGDIPLPDGLTKEIIPEGDIHLQEERRLFYVAMTRAKDRLFFTSAEDYGGKTKRKPSKFLADLGLAQTDAVPTTVVLPPPKPTEIVGQELPELKPPKQFSFTQLAAYGSCPLQYKFAHILRLPVFGKPAFSFGRTMHLTLENFMQELTRRRGQGQGRLFAGTESSDEELSVSLPELLEMYERHWQDDWYPNRAEKEAFRAKGKQLLEKFHEDIKADPPKAIALEQDFMVKIAGQSVRGKIDRIDQLADGTVELIDYKTGKAKEESKLDTGGKRQLLLYQIAAGRVLGYRPSKLTFHYLEGGKRISFLGSDDDLSKLETYLEEMIGRIQEGDFSPTPGWQCQSCDFASICEFRDR